MGIDEIKKHFFPQLEGELVNEITCEEILAEKVCHDLREAAKKFKIKVEVIDKLVREALDKELRKAKDIIHYIRTKIVDMAKNFKCTDALPEDVCVKIKEIAAKFKVDYQKVMKVIKDIIAKGITKAKEIIDEIKKHFFPQLEGELVNEITCEDILAEKVCHDLREAAKKFKIKVEVIDKLVREALDKELRKAKDIIHYIRTKIVDMAKNFKCTDALPEDVCAKIKEIAAKLKIKVSEVDRIIRELVAKKITEAKEIIKHLKEKLIELATNFKCTDVLSKNMCDEVHAFAEKIKIAAKEVDEIIKKIVVAGVTKAEEIIKKIIEHFFPHH